MKKLWILFHWTYDFLVGFFADKQAKLWHCDGIAGAFPYKPETDSVQGDPNKDIFEYWEMLANTGDADAQNNLGLMYYGGRGTEKDEELALKYFQLAVEQGHAAAQKNFRLLKEAIDTEKKS